MDKGVIVLAVFVSMVFLLNATAQAEAAEATPLTRGFDMVDVTYPAPVIASPLNQTYNTNQVQLTYTINNRVVWAFYQLDDSSAWESFSGSQTTTVKNLSEGSHKIDVTVQYIVTEGTGEIYTQKATVFFAIDSTSFNANALLFVVPVVTVIVVIVLITLIYFKKT
jgi:hypothetical protein